MSLQKKVLIACEHSGVLRRAFREAGFAAWSCDLLPAEDYSRFHIQRDIWHVLQESAEGEWALLIGHPPCTYLARSGARWWQDLEPWKQLNAIAFARMLGETTKAQRTVIENPIGKLGTAWRPADQIIHPWQFGHGEQKATCLWLRGVPPLQPTEITPLRMERIHGRGESKDRWKHRSRTYTGIANAMVTQWGPLL